MNTIRFEDRVYRWKRKDEMDEFMLYLESTIDGGCGNPWNTLSDKEREIVMSQKPKETNLPFNVVIRNHLLNLEQCKDSIIKAIGGDCTGIYLDLCGKLYTLYDYEIMNGDVGDQKRTSSIKNINFFFSLMKLLGTRVIIRLGDGSFREEWYSYLENKYLQTIVVHPMRCEYLFNHKLITLSNDGFKLPGDNNDNDNDNDGEDDNDGDDENNNDDDGEDDNDEDEDGEDDNDGDDEDNDDEDNNNDEDNDDEDNDNNGIDSRITKLESKIQYLLGEIEYLKGHICE